MNDTHNINTTADNMVTDDPIIKGDMIPVAKQWLKELEEKRFGYYDAKQVKKREEEGDIDKLMDQKFSCGICFNEFYPNQVNNKVKISDKCIHTFCEYCYHEWAVMQQDNKAIQCPKFKCKTYYTWEEVQKIDKTKRFERYLKMLVGANSAPTDMIFCTGKDCGNNIDLRT